MASTPGRLISLASMVMTVPLKVPVFPERGSAVKAQVAATGVGGALDVMLPAHLQGIPVVNLCPLGTGPNSMLVRQALRRSGIASEAVEMVGDTGMALILIEEGGYYTSVITSGIEAELEIGALTRYDVHPGDYIYLSAGDLVNPAYRRAVLAWLAMVGDTARIVLAASELAGQLRAEWLSAVLPFVHVFTANASQADQVVEVLGCDIGSQTFMNTLGEDALAVVRTGADGAMLYRVGQDDIMVQSMPTTVVDTLGVGATHTGVLIAGLMSGLDPVQAVQRANAAGAIAVSHAGASVDVTPDKIDELIDHTR